MWNGWTGFGFVECVGRDGIDEMCVMAWMNGMDGRVHHLYSAQQSSCDRIVHT